MTHNQSDISFVYKNTINTQNLKNKHVKSSFIRIKLIKLDPAPNGSDVKNLFCAINIKDLFDNDQSSSKYKSTKFLRFIKCY
jgi:hypothetical protein